MGVATTVPAVLICPVNASVEDSTVLGAEVTGATAVDVSPGIKLTETLSVVRLELRDWDSVWLVAGTSVELAVGTMLAAELVSLSVGVVVN